ncbi:MAG: adenylate/guanylate cyclase domain-containing protein, partial [Cyanobacteria bacterium P01_F01_bin.150]
TSHELEERVIERTAALNQANQYLVNEQQKNRRLLLNILPSQIAEELKQGHSNIAKSHDQVTILFADLVGFTELSSKMPAIELVNLLNQVFSEFDRLAEFYRLEKIKTIGDAYMVVGGLPIPDENHAVAIADMALAMREYITKFRGPTGNQLELRIGINTGSVVAGVIGTKKFIYDLWGDTVNVASRMESSGLAGQIQVAETTYRYLKARYVVQERGLVSIKGKGQMQTYWLLGKKAEITEQVRPNAR